MHDPLPPRPLPPDEQPPRGSWLPILFAFAGLAGLLAILIQLTGRIGAMMVGVVAVLLALPLLHYLAWGWWMSAAITRDEEDDQPPPGPRGKS